MADDGTQPGDVIARLLDIDVRRVQQLAKEGIIPRQRRGRYELVGAIRGYVRFLRSRINNGESVDLDTERRRILTSRANMAEMEERQRRRELIPLKEVDDFLTAVFTRFRQSIISQEDRLAQRVTDAEEIDQSRAILRAEAHALLSDLAQEFADAPVVVDAGGQPVELAAAPAKSDRQRVG